MSPVSPTFYGAQVMVRRAEAAASAGAGQDALPSSSIVAPVAQVAATSCSPD